MVNKIIFAAGRELNYVRNYLMLQAASSLSNVTAIIPNQPGSLLRNMLSVLFRLVPVLRRPHDLVILGFYSHPLIPIVRRLTAAPILFDAFVSTWDTLCFDRQKFSPTSIRGQVARRVDIAACHSATRVLVDTQTHAQFFIDTFELDATRVDHWYVGCNETIFQPRPHSPRPDSTLTVFFYGTYQPLHGVDVIIQAATLLKDNPNLRFKLVGEGQTFKRAVQLAQTAGTPHLELLPPVPLASLATLIAESDICLTGPFGSTPKSARVIPGKTAQFLSMARPIIATDTPANRELLTHRLSAILCRPADPQSLAQAILLLSENDSMRRSLAAAGRQLFEDRLSLLRLTADLSAIVDKTLHVRERSAVSNRSTH